MRHLKLLWVLYTLKIYEQNPWADSEITGSKQLIIKREERMGAAG